MNPKVRHQDEGYLRFLDRAIVVSFSLLAVLIVVGIVAQLIHFYG